jgi:dihydroorotase
MTNPGPTRRGFLKQFGAAAAVLPHSAAGLWQAGASGTIDLLIAGGRVIDPAQKLAGERDVAITGGRISQVAANIPRARAREVLDARGRIVTPGLIDMHVHVFDGVALASIDPDSIGIRMGVTTLVDAGSAGAQTFAGFRKHVIDRATTSVFALINISAIGFVVSNESYIDPKLIDSKAAIRVIEQNRDRILGIKVRIDGRDETATADLEIMRRGREASDATGVPILMHWARDPRLVAMLKAGDIITHPFNPPRAGPDVLGPDGNVMAQYFSLEERGIFTDFAHGGHLLWATAERAAAQGWFPDIISTDLHRAHMAPNGNVVDLETTMAKFLHLGMSLEQVVAAVTANPARALKYPEKIGTLEVGTVADVTVLDVTKKDIELRDSTRDTRTGRQTVTHVATVKSGKVFKSTGS